MPLVEVKLPLDTPRKERSSPYSLYGVSIRPSFTVPQRLSERPTNESRCAKRESLESTWNSVSICQMAFRLPPSFSWPRRPKREFDDSISVRLMIALSPAAAPQIVHVGEPADVAPELLGNTNSGYTLP